MQIFVGIAGFVVLSYLAAAVAESAWFDAFERRAPKASMAFQVLSFFVPFAGAGAVWGPPTLWFIVGMWSWVFCVAGVGLAAMLTTGRLFDHGRLVRLASYRHWIERRVYWIVGLAGGTWLFSLLWTLKRRLFGP